MGLIPSSCRLLIREHKRAHFQGPLLTLGNQDIWATYADLKGFFQELDCPYEEATVRQHTSQHLRELGDVSRDFVHARTFFEMMGLGDYHDMDKLDMDEAMILHDLNAPVPPDLVDRFNTIVDGGTLEHVFDVRMVMQNIVSMSRVGGRIVHLSPSSNFVDHGLYSFSPCFFFDFYSANGFDDMVCQVWQHDQDDYFARSRYFDYTYGMNVRGLIDPNRSTLVFFSARKAAAVDRVAIPTQGVYQGIERAAPTFERSLMGRIVPVSLRPAVDRVVLAARSVGEAVVPRYKRLDTI